MSPASFDFVPLQKAHFELLLRWLQTPHVRTGWDSDISWTFEKIEEKYGSYVDGYKLHQGFKKPLYAYIMHYNQKAIGFVQYYNAYDFPREDGLLLEGLPEKLAAFDLYIGESGWVGKGLGPLFINQLLEQHIWKAFEACFVDPDAAHKRAVRAYEKAGFKTVKVVQEGKVLWMIKMRN